MMFNKFNKKIAPALAGMLVFGVAFDARADQDFYALGTGRDGAMTVSTVNAQLNVYAGLAADATAGATDLTLTSAAGIAAGDLVMIWQTQRAAAGGPAIGAQADADLGALSVGQWEFARVASVASDTLTLSAGLSRAYAATGAQVIRVPEYTTLTINAGQSAVAKPWDGVSGGVVVALVQGALVNNGTISVAAQGFRGGVLVHDQAGPNGCDALTVVAPNGGQRGEGLLAGAFGASATGRGNHVQGGGGGVCHNAGGGGGGHIALGGLGGRSYDGARLVGGLGGARLVYDPTTRLSMGGGGGAGHGNNGTGSSGGRGGGTIFIRSASVSGAGTFSANGASLGTGGNDGQGGGGAAGAIVLRARTTIDCTTLGAAGGAGGSLGTSVHGPGGGGSGGLIATQQSGGVCTTNVVAGLAGVQTSAAATDGVHFGAQPTPTTIAQFAGRVQAITATTTTISTPASDSVVGGQPTISGTSTPGASVRVQVDGVTLGVVTADAAGVWALILVAPLSDGAHTISAQTAGSIAAPTTRTFTADVTAPNLAITAPAAGAAVNAAPTITGTSEPGATITVLLNGQTIGTTTADAAGAWSLALSGLSDGDYAVSATATDAVNNTSAPATTSFTLDTAAPLAAVVTTPTSGAVLSTTTPTITGTAEANGLVTVIIDGVAVGTTTADAAGAWTFTTPSALTEGAHAVAATVTDAASNTSPPSVPNVFEIDTTAPLAAVVSTPADGAVTSDETPTITGTAEAGATVGVFIDGALLGTTTASPQGQWTITPNAPLSEGPHTVSATATDAAGNQGPASTTNTFTVDVTAPVVTIASPADGALINDSTPTFSGTTEPGAVVDVRVDGGSIGTVTADATGAWTLTAPNPIADGGHTVSASAIDVAGNASAADATGAFTLDATAPVTTITGPADGATLSAPPTITGTSEPGATVIVTLNGQTIGTVTADGAGVWSLATSAALPGGLYSVAATGTDAAGNQGFTTTSDFTLQRLSVDVLDPAPANTAAYTITGTTEPGQVVTIEQDGQVVGTVTAAADGTWSYQSADLPEGDYAITARVSQGGDEATDTTVATLDRTAPALDIASPVDGATTNVTTPPISGTAEPGAAIEVLVNGETLATVADAAGLWSVTPSGALPFGATTITATASDEAGNTTTDTTTITVVDDASPLDLTILSPADLATITTRTPTITGITAPGATVEVFVDGASVGTATADGAGAWSLTIPDNSALAFGDRAIEARSTDGQDTATVAISVTVVDPVMVPLVLTTPADGATTADDTPTISGTAAPGATVEVFVDGTSLGTVTADANGAWTIDAPALDDGAHTIRAESGQDAATASVTVDTTAPTTTLTSPTAGETVTTGTPTFTGTGEPGSTVTVLIDGVAVGTATVGADGAWTVTPTTPITDGEHTVTVTATDAVGNSATLDPITVTIDTDGAMPPTGTITRPSAGDTATTGTPTISGTATPGATVEILVDGQVIDTVTADANGMWSTTPTTPIADGAHTIEVRVTLDGQSTTVGPITITVDTSDGARDTSDYMLAGGCTSTPAPAETPDAGLGLLGMLLGLIGWRRRR